MLISTALSSDIFPVIIAIMIAITLMMLVLPPLVILACLICYRRSTRLTGEDNTPLNTMELEREEESTHSSTVTSLT